MISGFWCASSAFKAPEGNIEARSVISNEGSHDAPPSSQMNSRRFTHASLIYDGKTIPDMLAA
jgi:hypothetical protein